jgi:hypothetical protein
MAAFQSVFQVKDQAMSFGKRFRAPSECLSGRFRIPVFGNNDVTRLENESVFFDELVAEKKTTTEVGLESPEYIDRHRYQIDQLEGFSTSSFRFDSVDNTFSGQQFLFVGFNTGGMKWHADEAIQKNEKYCTS